MIRELCHDEAILTTPSEPATAEDAAVAQDLIDTIASIDDGACLAANQIGVLKRVIVWKDDNGEFHTMYNPKLLMGLGGVKLPEACLTHPEETKVTRYAKVKVIFDDLVDGELKQRRRDLTGWDAQMVQHMIDHCNGKNI